MSREFGSGHEDRTVGAIRAGQFLHFIESYAGPRLPSKSLQELIEGDVVIGGEIDALLVEKRQPREKRPAVIRALRENLGDVLESHAGQRDLGVAAARFYPLVVYLHEFVWLQNPRPRRWAS